MGKYAGFGAAGLLIAGLLALLLFPDKQVSEDGTVCTDNRVLSLSGTDTLAKRLQNTNLLNGNEIYDRLDLGSDNKETGQADASSSRGAGGFFTPSPYEPRYRESYSSIFGVALSLARECEELRARRDQDNVSVLRSGTSSAVALIIRLKYRGVCRPVRGPRTRGLPAAHISRPQKRAY